MFFAEQEAKIRWLIQRRLLPTDAGHGLVAIKQRRKLFPTGQQFHQAAGVRKLSLSVQCSTTDR